MINQDKIVWNKTKFFL